MDNEKPVIDCRLSDCIHNTGGGTCTYPSPIIKLSECGTFTCLSEIAIQPDEIKAAADIIGSHIRCQPTEDNEIEMRTLNLIAKVGELSYGETVRRVKSLG